MNKPRSITHDEALRIREYLTGQDKLIFDFGIETGLRISDILKIKARYIDKIMYVKESKTKKRKIVEISDDLFLRLKPLMDYDRRVYAFGSPRTRLEPLHRSTYHLHLKKACEALSVNFSAHSTRKLYALNIFKETRDIFAVQKALNHKYVTTTCSYLDIDLGKLVGEQAGNYCISSSD